MDLNWGDGYKTLRETFPIDREKSEELRQKEHLKQRAVMLCVALCM